MELLLNLLKTLRFDRWWNVVFCLGVAMGAASLVWNVDFLENKHIFGLAIGMIMVGLSQVIALKEHQAIKPPNVYTGGALLVTFEQTEHNLVSILLFVLGTLIVIIFVAKLIFQLL